MCASNDRTLIPGRRFGISIEVPNQVTPGMGIPLSVRPTTLTPEKADNYAKREFAGAARIVKTSSP